jgi:23S rRNA pseudouridine955/2504/2580 synthase
VLGDWPGNKKVLNQPLHKYLLENGERRVKIVDATDPNGMPSVSLVKKVAVGPRHPQLEQQAFSLLEVTIKTGRTHQIRVHLAGNGHVIAGDDKYGNFEMNKKLAKVGLKRMFLHAWNLRLSHPATGQEMTFNCPLDEELTAVKDSLLQDIAN